MKYLIVLVVVFVGIWLWRSNRRADAIAQREENAAKPAQPALAPQDMVRCPVCALHLPQVDAIAGQRGHYCTAAHRQQAEG